MDDKRPPDINIVLKGIRSMARGTMMKRTGWYNIEKSRENSPLYILYKSSSMTVFTKKRKKFTAYSREVVVIG